MTTSTLSAPVQSCQVQTGLVVSPIDLPKVKIATLDVATGKRIESETVYQNNLAAAMHTLDTVRAWDLSRVPEEAIVTALRKCDSKAKGHLDGATGSRKKGILIATSGVEKGVIESYFKGSKRITHGSILFSECRKMFAVNSLPYVVMKDSDAGLGDCHGMISETLYAQLQEHHHIPDRTAIQFRFGVTGKWVAKGVVVPYPDSYLPEGTHLVLPNSCFKGMCPELYLQQTDDAVFGILHLSKRRKFKSSHQVVQCFTSQAAQQYLGEVCRQSMIDLLTLRHDHTAFCRKMVEDLNYTEGMDSEQLEDAVSEDDRMTVLRIGMSDAHYQMAGHPAITRAMNRLFRRKVVDIATGKFLFATGLTATPLDNLKPGYVLSNSLPTGDYITFRYPVRHYGDIRMVKVVNPNNPLDCNGKVVDVNKRISSALKGGQSKLTEHQQLFVNRQWNGTFAINPEYALEVGMDFDGK